MSIASNVELATSPYDEIVSLDRGVVDRAMGNVEEADARLHNGISKRGNDGTPSTGRHRTG